MKQEPKPEHDCKFHFTGRYVQIRGMECCVYECSICGKKGYTDIDRRATMAGEVVGKEYAK